MERNLGPSDKPENNFILYLLMFFEAKATKHKWLIPHYQSIPGNSGTELGTGSQLWADNLLISALCEADFGLWLLGENRAIFFSVSLWKTVIFDAGPCRLVYGWR